MLSSYNIIIKRFLIRDKLYKIVFYKETFLLVDTSIDVVLGIFFPIFINAKIQFNIKDFT